jgi:outer membrane protein assembly factor BamB
MARGVQLAEHQVVPGRRRNAWLGQSLWLAVAVAITSTARAGDGWPMYGHDPARSQLTAAPLQMPLQTSWVFQSLHAPDPAWSAPKGVPIEDILELRRVHFDDVFQVVSADGSVYFGSSADNKVYCLDATTGQIGWTALTGGPIRLAPTVVDGRVYVGSDDGYAYCLNAKDGSVVWKFHAAPTDRRVLGHGRMISLWPLRTGILVDRGVAYLGAGVFPAEGVFLYALDAATGRELWRNDHCGEAPQSIISPQGYLLASSSTLYVPMGRVSPAAFDLKSGKLLSTAYFGKPVGGTYALLAGDEVFTGTEEMVGYRGRRDVFAAFTGRKLVVTADTAYVATDTQLSALDRKRFPAASRKVATLRTQLADLNQTLRSSKKLKKGTDAEREQYAQMEKRIVTLTDQLKQAQAAFAATVRWKVPCKCPDALILAGDTLVAGGTNQVVALAADSGATRWTSPVEGTAKGLASAGGRLLVSTDKGVIYCFGPQRGPQATVRPQTVADPYANAPSPQLSGEAAEAILRQSGVRRGYCLVLGVETGQLALELAKRSELRIYAVSPDAAKVAAAQKAIDAAGFHGTRICVEQWPLDNLPYADYFANLIVSETTAITGQLPPAETIARLLKPLGGVAVVGQPGDTEKNNVQNQEVIARLTSDRQFKAMPPVGDKRAWPMLVRGPLPEAGNWTHLYANAGNTACSDDNALRCPLEVLWFGQPGPAHMVSRHSRAASPLVVDGRMFVQGENIVMAYDAYNGVKLWEREIPGAMRVNASHDGGNLTANGEALFVAIGDRCLRLDPATGETVHTYQVPPAADGKRRRWGYVACVGKLLYGSRSPVSINSEALFAFDLDSGKLRWLYAGKQISNNSIAIGDGRVFLVDQKATDEQRQQVVDEKRQQLQNLPDQQRTKAEQSLDKTDVRLAVALNAETGQTVWQQPIDLTDCAGGGVASMYNRGVLLVFGVYLDGHYWQQFFAGQFASRRITALSHDDGRQLWSEPVGYRVRPLIIGDTLHAEPWAFDLRTGKPKTRVHPVTDREDRWQFARPGHHCGLPVASPHALFFRSACFGYYDLDSDAGTMHFGAQRPGCWINFIPAAGLLLLPEASVGCMCPFPNMCSVAFKPAAQNKAFAYYSAPGPLTPVRDLAINLGAPGDRRDREGTLWLGFPRPVGSLVLKLPLEVAFYPGGTFVGRNSTYTPIAGTATPWLYTSAARGLQKCAIPLLGQADGTAAYTVRLAFADPDNDEPGRRVFDVKLQGKQVLANFDIAKEAGGRDRPVVKVFADVEVRDKLVIELVAKTDPRAPEQTPILEGVQVARGRVLRLGCAVPDLVVSHFAPKQTAEVALANIRDATFSGKLEVVSPRGFTVSPATLDLQLARNQRKTIPVAVTVDDSLTAGTYPLTVRLLRSDGTVELERRATVEHLGRRGRVVLTPVADVSVQQRYPDLNKGTASVLLVDGGNASMGDIDHSLALLKFRLDVPGRPVAVRIRIPNAGNPSGDGGRLCLVVEPWDEEKVTYATRPKLGQEVARLGRSAEREVIQRPLTIDLEGKTELSLAIDPTSCDGVDYLSRESGEPAQLIIDYEPRE